MDSNEEAHLYRSLREDSTMGDGRETGRYYNPSTPHRPPYTNTHQTRPKNTECDGVGVIAILRDSEKGPSLLLQKQFRPPLNRVTIEVPSGLIDEGETITQSALRELKEETGYVATMSKGEREDGGFIMWNDPGFCVSLCHFLLACCISNGNESLLDVLQGNPLS
jgi:8-oxo-dGTP pyrophosphatase MutT (NUDIX family)